MTITGERAALTFEVMERIPNTLPTPGDLRCSVAISCDGFSGSDPDVWFTRPDLDTFIAELQLLERNRSGTAQLTDCSYGSEVDGVLIDLRMIDTPGHVLMRVEVRRPHYTGNGALARKELVVEFELPSDQFAATVGELDSLLR